MSEIVEAIRATGTIHLGGAFIDCDRLANYMDSIGWKGTPEELAEELAEVNRRLKLCHDAMVEMTADITADTPTV